jgi:hypothetical protein
MLAAAFCGLANAVRTCDAQKKRGKDATYLIGLGLLLSGEKSVRDRAL